jgi:Tfp pilus assembly ATPase PilU
MDISIKQLMLSDSDRVTKFWSQKDMDFAYTSKNGMTYRVNAYVKQNKTAMAIRKINASAKKLDELMYTDVAENVKKHILERKT